MFQKLHHQTPKFQAPPPLLLQQQQRQQPQFHHHHHYQIEQRQASDDTTDSRSTGAAAAAPHADGASIEVVRRPRGRPPGSTNKPKPPVVITRDGGVGGSVETSMSPYVLELPGGIDIVDAIGRFCRKRSIGLCVLTGSGTVANVTLRQPSLSTPASTVTFHGRFDLLSLSATILPSGSSAISASISNLFTISLAGPQGQIVGGAVVGALIAAGTVYVIAASFNNPSFHRLPLEEDQVRNSSTSGGTTTEQGRQSPPGQAVSGGGGDGGHPPSSAAAESCGMSMYSCHLPSSSDVIWAPTARQPQPPPY